MNTNCVMHTLVMICLLIVLLFIKIPSNIYKRAQMHGMSYVDDPLNRSIYFCYNILHRARYE